MNITEWTEHLNAQIKEAKRISEKFPSVDVCSDQDGFNTYFLKCPTENELLLATRCLSSLFSKSIQTIKLRLYYDEPCVYVEILDVCLDDYKSLEDFADHICPGEKFLEKLKSLMTETPNQFDNINEWLANK